MDIVTMLNQFGADFLGLDGALTLTSLLSQMGAGLVVTGQVFVITLLGSLPLGILIALGRMSKFKPLAWLMRLYISFMRGTPLMLQLMALYYIPYYVFGIKLNLLNIGPMDIGPLGVNIPWVMTACCIGFILNYAAYFAEIYRGGISSVPEGQYEAAKVLGISRSKTFFIIILPQVFKRVLPAVTNEIITLVKDTSLAFAIGLIEMFTRAKQLASKEVSMLPYAAAALIYYLFNLAVAGVMSLIEKKMNRYRIK